MHPIQLRLSCRSDNQISLHAYQLSHKTNRVNNLGLLVGICKVISVNWRLTLSKKQKEEEKTRTSEIIRREQNNNTDSVSFDIKGENWKTPNMEKISLQHNTYVHRNLCSGYDVPQLPDDLVPIGDLSFG